MAAHYFVYYRIDPTRSGASATAVARAQEDLSRRTGVTGRCLRRADDATTWMEIYEHVTDRDTFEACLAAVVREHDLERWLAPEARRHLECFEG